MATYSEFLDSKPLPPKRGWRRIRRHLPRASVLLITLLLIAIVLWPYVVVSVPTGQVGILWYRLIGFDPYCMCLVRGTVLDPSGALTRNIGSPAVRLWFTLYTSSASGSSPDRASILPFSSRTVITAISLDVPSSRACMRNARG